MKKVFIVGAYGQNNLGDEALLEVFMKQFAGDELTVNSAQPELTAKRYGVKSVGTYWNWPPKFTRLRAMWQADIIVFGGGSLLKEIEGNGIARIMYFARILLMLFFARVTGKQTAMLGNGMGPLKYPFYKFLTRLAARLTDVICVRDSESRDLLVSIGIKRPVHVTADAVFSLDTSSMTEPVEMPFADSSPFVVVVPRYSLTEAERKAFAQACDYLVERHKMKILMLPFQTAYHAHFDDEEACNAIQAMMQHSDQAKVWVTESPAAAFQVIGKAQLVLSVRLHALIFASIQSVPPVAISYEVKVGSFMAELGQSFYNLTLSDLESGKVSPVLDRAFADQSIIRPQLKDRSVILREQSLRNFEILRETPQSSGSLLTGGAALFISMTIVNAGNYVFNLLLGRKLGPKAFADLSLIVTLMLMLTFVTSTVSLLAARFSAKYQALGDYDQLVGLRKMVGKWSWIVGFLVMGVLVLGAPIFSQVFQTASALPFMILGVGVPIFFAQAVDRGILQGQTRFGRLALSYQAEMWVRLVGAVVFVGLGFAVNGAVAALSLSFFATWWIARGVSKGLPAKGEVSASERTAVLKYIAPIGVALVSQILINNSDILIVKHYFESEVAGHYAALALIGRIVFFATMSVVTMLFPIVAQKHQKGEAHRHLLYISLALVAAVSLVIIGVTVVAPNWVVNVLFGAAYLGIAPLLWLYAVATAFYALSNVIINYRLSTGDGNGAKLAIGGSALQVVGLLLFHGTLEQVVMVQVLAMGVMLAALAIWDGRLAMKTKPISVPSTTSFPSSDQPVVTEGVS